MSHGSVEVNLPAGRNAVFVVVGEGIVVGGINLEEHVVDSAVAVVVVVAGISEVAALRDVHELHGNFGNGGVGVLEAVAVTFFDKVERVLSPVAVETLPDKLFVGGKVVEIFADEIWRTGIVGINPIAERELEPFDGKFLVGESGIAGAGFGND